MSLHSDLFTAVSATAAPDLLNTGWRIGIALALGASIGVERQWRAGLAGLRTNALVSVGAALFVVMGAYGFGEGINADPTRVAAQVVSGIGFLGAGVILREGLNIRGLNTAATLWCSAAVGCLAGVGMIWVALIGTFVIVFANIFLRPLGRVVNRTTGRYRPAPPEGAEYSFEVLTNDKSEPRVRALLLESVSRPEYKLKSITSSRGKGNGVVTLQADIHATVADPSPLERAVSRMSLDPKVSIARWWAHEHGDHEDDEDEA